VSTRIPAISPPIPNGVYVVFTNMYEYTDGTGDLDSCPGAELGGFDGDFPARDALAEMVIHANEEFARIAVETGTDMVFLLEAFCGHGYNPNPTGHGAIADMILDLVDE